MKSVPNFSVMANYLHMEGFEVTNSTLPSSITFSKEESRETIKVFISHDHAEGAEDTAASIRYLAHLANISERGMVSRIIKSWVNAHLMRPTK